ncbi:MAG: hypothetical protein AAGF31_03330 [Planctomycetota bacterium]
MGKVYLGDDFLLYIDTANNWSSPTWVLVECIEDLAIDPQPITAQINKRGKKTPGYKRGRFDQMLSFKLLNSEDDTEFDAIENAIWNQTNDGTEILHLALVRGDITVSGNKIWENDFIVSGAPLDPSLDEGASYDVECKPAADSDEELTVGTTS